VNRATATARGSTHPQGEYNHQGCARILVFGHVTMRLETRCCFRECSAAKSELDTRARSVRQAWSVSNDATSLDQALSRPSTPQEVAGGVQSTGECWVGEFSVAMNSGLNLIHVDMERRVTPGVCSEGCTAWSCPERPCRTQPLAAWGCVRVGRSIPRLPGEVDTP
jgi:hypothetical protein